MDIDKLTDKQLKKALRQLNEDSIMLSPDWEDKVIKAVERKNRIVPLWRKISGVAAGLLIAIGLCCLGLLNRKHSEPAAEFIAMADVDITLTISAPEPEEQPTIAPVRKSAPAPKPEAKAGKEENILIFFDEYQDPVTETDNYSTPAVWVDELINAQIINEYSQMMCSLAPEPTEDVTVKANIDTEPSQILF